MTILYKLFFLNLFVVLFVLPSLQAENIATVIKVIDGDTLKIKYQSNTIKVEFDVQQRDRYRRILGYIYLNNGKMLNEEIIKAGYANIMTVPPNVKHQEVFLIAYREASNNRKGLWKGVENE